LTTLFLDHQVARTLGQRHFWSVRRHCCSGNGDFGIAEGAAEPTPWILNRKTLRFLWHAVFQAGHAVAASSDVSAAVDAAFLAYPPVMIAWQRRRRMIRRLRCSGHVVSKSSVGADGLDTPFHLIAKQ
jgi:hypothetical protein